MEPGGSGNVTARSRRTSGTDSPMSSWSSFFPPLPAALSQLGEEGMSQEDQRDVSMPTAPGTHLVLVQSTLSLGFLQTLLH